MFKKKKPIGARLKALFSLGVKNEAFYEQLEDRLIEADIGAKIAMELSDQLRQEADSQRIRDAQELEQFIRTRLSQMINSANLDPQPGESRVVLFLGVNGVGKTTSMAKLAHRWKQLGCNIILAAGDTFRAAAVEQLAVHAQRLDVRIVKQGQGADPAAVIFDAIESASSNWAASKPALVLADSAGRMHNKAQLVQELQKIDKIIRSKAGQVSYQKYLVIDSTTGQNGIQQAEVFHEAVGVDAIILSKYDSKARGGLALSISRSLGIPFGFMGTGEGYEDVLPFDGSLLVENILSSIAR